MAVTPVFNLSDNTEKAEIIALLNNYKEFATSGFGVTPYTGLQYIINEASLKIYNFTKYWPQKTSQTKTVRLDSAGKGYLGCKLPANITSITINDPEWEGVSLSTTDFLLHENGLIELKAYVYEGRNYRLYPSSITFVLDYGFVKATQMPDEFKYVCAELVMHLINLKTDEAYRSLLEQKEGDSQQKYRDPVNVEKAILGKLKGVVV